MKIRDRIWLWGQDVMSHHQVGPRKENIWNLPGINRMDPAEGARFLGIRNICRVVMNGSPEPPFDGEMEKLAGCDRVIWSVLGDSGSDRPGDVQDDLEELLALARRYPNLKGGILDDFFRPLSAQWATDQMARLPLERVRTIKARLHSAEPSLELWIVIYESALSEYYRSYLAECDAVTFWTWHGEHLDDLAGNLSRVFELSPGKKHLAGCYAYDYGNCRPLAPERMRKQCSVYADYLKRDLLQGVIICSNCIADIGLKEIDYLRGWIAEIGDETVIPADEEALPETKNVSA